MDRRLWRNMDWSFLLAVLVLVGSGLVVLSSAGASVAQDPYLYVEKQLLWFVLGLVAAGAALAVNYAGLARFGWLFYVLNLIMLLSVLVVGKVTNGAQSWINLGPFVLQPSEFSKVLMIVSFASFLRGREAHLSSFGELLPCFLYFMPPMLLIMAQPDLGTSLVFLAILFGMLFLAGANQRLLAGLIGGGLAAVVAVLWGHFRFGLPLPLEDYQLMRLVVFLNPYNDGEMGRGAGYQLIQSQVAIGSGGFWGKGLYQGSQIQLNFLPEHHTDFIFSVVGEELGFAGAIFVLAFYFLLLYRLLRMAGEARDQFGTLLIGGTVSMLLFHVLVNVGMTIGMMPITGIPLPLFSYGGSSMLATMLALALSLNVYLRRQRIIF